MSESTSTQVPVLTVKQPWADLIMADVKDVENRTWRVPSTLPQWWRCSHGHRELTWADEDGVVRGCPVRGCADGERDVRLHPDGAFPFRLGIHAGKQVDSSEWAWSMHSREWGRTIGWYREQVVANRTGVLLGFVTVTGCHHADEFEYEHGDTTAYSYCSRWAEPGVWHWTLTDPEPLRGPIPMKGRTGLWWTDDPTTAAV